jgi:hypothetical protein
MFFLQSISLTVQRFASAKRAIRVLFYSRFMLLSLHMTSLSNLVAVRALLTLHRTVNICDCRAAVDKPRSSLNEIGGTYKDCSFS